MNKAIMLLNDVLINIQAGQADWDTVYDRLMVVKTSLEEWNKQFEKELKIASNIVDDILKGANNGSKMVHETRLENKTGD